MLSINTVFRVFGTLQLTAILVCSVLCAPESFAQFSSRANDRGSISVGSKWSRRPSSGANYIGQSTQSFGSFVPRPQSGGLQYYGGTVVGNGLTVYPPGYFGAIYHYPGYGYAYGPTWIGASVSSARFGRLPNAYVPWVAPGYYGAPYAYPYPYDYSWPGVVPSTPVTITPKEPAHAPAVAVAVPDVKFDRGFSLRSPYAVEPPLDYADVRKRIVVATRNDAVVDEFVAAAVTADAEPEELRSIESLRLQTKGDKALQAADLELARTFYQSAIAADPTRKGVWYRMALVQLYQHDFDAAASSLKRVVTTVAASATEFIDLVTLLGRENDSAQWAADQSIWNWLMDRPASVDRLHLVAAWQGFLGNQQRAQELVELATLAGSEESQTEMIVAVLSGSVPASDVVSDAANSPSAPETLDESLSHPESDAIEAPPLKIPQS